MNKICTSYEESKKIIELGLNANTADMGWRLTRNPDMANNQVWLITKVDKADVVAWSLSALLKLLPESIDEHTDDFSQLELTKYSVSYVYVYGNLRKEFTKDNLLDAAFEMVCWLLENKKI